MRAKRFLAALLAAALTAALAMPVGAANSSFDDVSDAAVAVNADVLRLMGVVDGVGGNRFQPSSNLTRAQFCTMVVNFMQEGEKVPLHATRTIFSDVTARHWALPYVNLAASLTVKDGEKDTPLISGVGNGKFQPDSKITMAQATTILIRVLGYSSQQAGAVWPQSYMNLAKSIGLTDGIQAGNNEAITRAQAAQLFVNALNCKTGGGQIYYESLGDAKDGTVVLAVNVNSDDGKGSGAVRTSGGVYLPKADHVAPVALQGRRGALVLNDKNEIVTFVPDDSTATTITLSGDAQPTYVKASGGSQYAISSGTLVYTADKTEGDSYLNAHTALKAGTQITMFAERGKIVAIYAGGSTAAATEAVVVMGNPSVAMFHQLTGGASSFSIRKGRQPITMSDIKPYDVVTYDAMTNTLEVSDLRLTCVYEDAAPSAKAPETISVLGHSFDVLESAWDYTHAFSVGDVVTLLLTADGNVAGMVKPGSGARSTAVGEVTDEGTVTVHLPNGGSFALSGDLSNKTLADQVVSISSGSKGRISVSKLSAKTAPGAFDVEKMTLGDLTVTGGVRIYEQLKGGAVKAIDRSKLDLDTISASQIATYHVNTAGMVDYIILNPVTGDAYIYGRAAVTTTTNQEQVTDENGDPVKDEDGNDVYEEVETRAIKLVNGTESREISGAYNLKNGAFYGVAFSTRGGILSMVDLTEIEKVSPADFFVSQGVTYVTAGGKTYRVSDEVECYKNANGGWFQGDDGTTRLAACKAYSSDLTIYVDPIGEKVRIVVAN